MTALMPYKVIRSKTNMTGWQQQLPFNDQFISINKPVGNGYVLFHSGASCYYFCLAPWTLKYRCVHNFSPHFKTKLVGTISKHYLSPYHMLATNQEGWDRCDLQGCELSPVFYITYIDWSDSIFECLEQSSEIHC